jgi:hypothetical protein
MYTKVDVCARRARWASSNYTHKFINSISSVCTKRGDKFCQLRSIFFISAVPILSLSLGSSNRASGDRRPESYKLRWKPEEILSS